MSQEEENNKQKAEGKRLLKEQTTEVGHLDNAFKSLAASMSMAFEEVIDNMQGVNEIGAKIAKSYERDITGSIKKMSSGLEDHIGLQLKINKGVNVQKQIDEKLEQSEVRRRLTLEKITRAEGLSVEEKVKLRGELDTQFKLEQKSLKKLKERNKENVKAKSLTSIMGDSMKKYADKIDESGTLSEVLSGNFKDTLTSARLTEVGMALLVQAMFAASDAINQVQKETGMSYQQALLFQGELALAAASSEKLFINSKELGKAFGELSIQTGLIADFGGDTLETQATLTKQLKLGATEAGNLSLMARLQSEDTETVLENSIETANALIKQSGVALNVKGLLKDVAGASDDIVVSLGKSTDKLIEAAGQAKLFGSNLQQVNQIAGTLLEFESSISNELEFELLTGKQINLEKARLYALNNDIAGLSSELADNEAIILAFSTGNRVQQDAAAKALGMSREELAKIALQQDYNNMSAAEFTDAYGETTYQSLQAQSASEKFADTLAKVQGIISDIGIIFAPLLDGFAALVGFIAQSKIALGALAGIMGTLMLKGLWSAITAIYSGFSWMGPFGIPLAIGAIAGLYAQLNTAKSKKLNQGGIVMPKAGGVNATIGEGGQAEAVIPLSKAKEMGFGGNNEIDYNKMATAMSNAQVNVSTKYDSFKSNSVGGHGTNYQSTKRYESKFA